MATKNPPAKKRPGRPAIDPGNETVPLSVRLTAVQRKKLDQLGGPSWIRERIDKAKLPKE
ncbi:MAG: hypothetical protein EOO27_11200 [Comamonadaceae bacterium]|nr:MAG: hypothetical protein EOO27_11200 [Comamonadaceae bacterium]